MMGTIRWQLALCSIFVYTVVYFALWKGPRSTGKAVWFTATMPFLVLFVLLIRGLTLPGAVNGISYYLTPKWHLLTNISVWIDAATQIFFSLGAGFGALLALASYNDFHNNCYRDALIASSVNCATSFIAGFVIFSTLGYMSTVLGKSVEEVVGEGGPGLIFIVYPQAIATMPGSTFWSLIFFLMLITLGLDSTFGGLEAIVTAFRDEFPNSIGPRRELFVLGLIIFCFVGSLPTLTYGGSYLIDFLDAYGVSYSLLVICTVEAIAVCWFYGVGKFCKNIKEMLGFTPGYFWRVCWMALSPAFIAVMLVFASLDLKPLVVNRYAYPKWSLIVGWILRIITLICIPGYMLYKFISTKGSFSERLLKSIRPQTIYDLSRRTEEFDKTPNVYFITSQI